jgi:adenylate cyclase
MSVMDDPFPRSHDGTQDDRSVDRCFVCVDLVGYTALTDTHGDTIAADLALALASHTRASLDHSDELVKLLGDGVLVATTNAPQALAFLDRLFGALAEDDFILATRTGLHHGSAVAVDGGDYLGAAVNMVARLAHEARPGEVIATSHVAQDAVARGDRAEPLGRRSLRHIGEEVDVFSIHLATSPPITGLDPVCHMRPAGDQFPITIRWRDETIGFCSEECAQQFVLRPEQFVDHRSDC